MLSESMMNFNPLMATRTYKNLNISWGH